MRQYILLLFLAITSKVYAKKITMNSLLKEMADPASVTKFPQYKLRQASSYDRRSIDAAATTYWYALGTR